MPGTEKGPLRDRSGSGEEAGSAGFARDTTLPRACSCTPGAARGRFGGPKRPRGKLLKKLRSAGFAVVGVVVAAGAVLLQLKTIRVVTPVLLGDVVALLADGARSEERRADVGCLGHCCLFLSGLRRFAQSRSTGRWVAGAGVEPATPR